MKRQTVKPLADVFFTILLWIYFTLGYILFFAPFYLLAFVFSRKREFAFQRLNHIFFRIFFRLVGCIPGSRIRVDPQIYSIRSSIILCNHLSFLDSIFMVSLFSVHKTIVKNMFFSLPIFGFVLRHSGYIPSNFHDRHEMLIFRQIEGMRDFLDSGGNLFIFPEGTRTKNGTVGDFHKGAFKIARKAKAPIAILWITGTDRLMPPGRFLFHTCMENEIRLKIIDTVYPDYLADGFSLNRLVEDIRGIFILHHRTEEK